MRRVIHEPAAASRAVSGALSMALLRKYWVFNLLHAVTVPTQTSARLVGRVGVEPTTLKRMDLQSTAFADSLPTHIVAPILWRDRRHRRFFLFLKGVLVYALIHQWWNRWDLNPQPFPCKGIALPIAPRPHISLFDPSRQTLSALPLPRRSRE